MRDHEESVQAHMAYAGQAPSGHYINPVYEQHRSQSFTSAHSDPAAQTYQQAMQHYQWPAPPMPYPQPSIPSIAQEQVTHPDRPPAPDAPDLSQRTIAGYEMLALELSSTNSPVKPLYRKFEYLNHRILLHLQDELCELEEQLRTLDEIIAQTDPASAEGQHTPASRRVEAYSHSEVHHRRTSLLGRIFLKTEQYNRAMSAYNRPGKTTLSAATEGDIQVYQDWMTRHVPIHEAEARFLQNGKDLMVPGKTAPGTETSTRQAALACLPVGLLLPLLLFSIIPTLLGRLAVTALIAVGAFIVAATTGIRYVMQPREWAVCGAAYVLLMAAIAGCVPLRGA
ncbi:hypothetical protein B0A50_02543 [Salinomyces thailandicus]|uniref:DUF6594 domain-containing protein n=1 Tax=Salinomyces thailandicus TaxID=706561 RepID=A0A4U0U799_9PEZI|nr:hypothetical protein B0A50_02543 [Salinomyces thailandica]